MGMISLVGVHIKAMVVLSFFHFVATNSLTIVARIPKLIEDGCSISSAGHGTAAASRMQHNA